MTITKTLAIVVGESQPRVFDTVEYEGKLWLVPSWIRSPIPGTSQPLRIMCLDGRPMQPADTRQGPREYDRVLAPPLDKDTLEGGIAQGLVVIERPDMIRNLYSTLIPEKNNRS